MNAEDAHQAAVDAVSQYGDAGAVESLKPLLAAVLDKLGELEEKTGALTSQQATAALDQLSAEVDSLAATLSPVIQHGGGHAHDFVALGLHRIYAQQRLGATSHLRTVVTEALLSRLFVLCLAFALAWDRLDLLARVERAGVDSRYGENLPTGLADDSGLRFVRLYDGDASVAYEQRLVWLRELALLRVEPLLRINGELEDAVAEADLVLALRSAIRREGRTYCAPARTEEWTPEFRLQARWRTTVQRQQVLAFIGAPDDNPEAALNQAHGSLGNNRHFPSRRVLFPAAEPNSSD